MPSNLLSLARDLQRRKARERRGATVIEGVRLLEEALAAGVTIRGVLVAASFGGGPREAKLLETLAHHAVARETVSEHELGEIADTQTPQGIVAVIDSVPAPLADIDPGNQGTILVLDAVQDPGNVGALLRTAWAFGARGAIVLDGTADLRSPKVSRAAMGATFRLPTASATLEEFATWVAGHELEVWVTDMRGENIRDLSPPTTVAVVVGNEGAGGRPQVGALASRRVAVPHAAEVESLNVVVAAGIVLYEVANA